MKLSKLLLKKCDDSGKNKNKKIYVDDSDDEVYDHSKPKTVPKEDTASKTIVPDDSKKLPEENININLMTSSTEADEHPKVCKPCSGAVSEIPATEEIQGTSGIEDKEGIQGRNVPQDDAMRKISEKMANYCSVVIQQKPTRMQTRAAESHYYYQRPCGENPIPRLPVIDGVASKLGLGRGSIARLRYSLPSIAGWSAVAFVTGAYFSLQLIENGLPKH